MTDEEQIDYCNKAIKALNFRARSYNCGTVKAAVNVAVKKIETLKTGFSGTHDDFVQEISHIWQPVLTATSTIKNKIDIQETESKQPENTAKREPIKSCSHCEHRFFHSFLGCDFKQGEPPFCAGFLLDRKGEVFNV